MKERRNRPGRNSGPARLETRKPRPQKRPQPAPRPKAPAVDLDMLVGLRRWWKGRGETATDDALSAADRSRRHELRLAFDRLFRHFARLTWLIRRQNAEVTPDLVWGAAAATLDRAPLEDIAKAIATRTVDIQPLAALLGRISNAALDDPEMPPDVRLECPPELYPMISAAYGPRAAAELAALNMPAPVDLRVNTLKAAELDLPDILLQPTPYARTARRAKGRPDLAATEAFTAGQFELQDEGSQLLAALVEAAPGKQVLDFCAGAGGKTLALAAAMNNRGRLVAADTSQRRLARAKLRLKRAGAENAERILLTGTDTDPFLKRRANWFDRVLVDAPCSGTGSWRRHPDAKWAREHRIETLTALQDQILARAAKLVKRGGRLVYGTCSVLPAENEQRAEAFLAAHPNFRPLDAATIWPRIANGPWPCATPRHLTLTPAQHGTDGFFAAVFERVS